VGGGEAPPLGLLQVAETIGGADWQPVCMDFSETLAGLISDIPEAMRGFAAVEAVLQESGEVADLEVIARSWFEGSPEIAQLMVDARGPQSSEAGLLSVTERHCPASRQMGSQLLRTALDARGVL
jgi:hypothetical protein